MNNHNNHREGNLALLGELNEQTILRVIKGRFQKDQIYSWCGSDILIAVNPYKQLDIYGTEQHKKYDWRTVSSKTEPHIYSTAALAYRRLQETQTEQIILVSGESGAGKTESTKFVIKHLLQMCGSTFNNLHSKIVEVNPLLEAFGNAQTTLNDNSSRFAKFIQIKFNGDGGVYGATIHDYLVEKSRVVHQSDREMNFHIFYYFLAGASSNVKGELFLEDKRRYRITQQLSRRKLNEDKRRYEECLQLMKMVELSKSDIGVVQTVLAAILHITEIEFQAQESDGVTVTNERDLINGATLLDIDVENFCEALVSEKIVVRGEEITILKNESEAANGRDALAKALYERLFGWLIRRINISLQSRETNSLSGRLGGIGILDICGFEIMETNGLEQLCINIVNEQLQNFMNNQVFKQEKEIYENEGLRLDFDTYPSNTEIISMFRKPKDGILDLINEDTKLNQSTNESMVRKIADRYASHSNFKSDRFNRPMFTIKHFAGEVEYDASSFLQKNGDNLSKGLKECCIHSRDNLISDLFKVEPSITGSISPQAYNYRQSQAGRPLGKRPVKGSQITKHKLIGLKQSVRKDNRNIAANAPKDTNTLLYYLESSLKDLLAKMKEAEPFFIRCIKSNVNQRAGSFCDDKVMEQLLYIGIRDIAAIRRLAYPLRRRYDDFRNRYGGLVPNSEPIHDDMMACKKILCTFFLNTKGYRLGRTQVFMVESVKNGLDCSLRLHQMYTQNLATRFVQKWKENIIRKKLKRAKPPSVRFKATFGAMTPIAEVATPVNPYYASQKTVDSVIDNNSVYDEIGNLKQEETLESKEDTEEEDEEEDEKEDEGVYEEGKFWDSFEIVSRETRQTEISNRRLLQCVKLFIYFVIFAVLTSSCVLHKISLVISIARFPIKTEVTVIGEEELVKKIYFVMNCVLAVCVPYVLNVFLSVGKIMFGRFEKPSLKTFIAVMVMESLHGFGIGFILLFVLPLLDAVMIICLLSAVASVPAFMLLVTSTHNTNKSEPIASCSTNPSGKAISYMLDGVSCLAQLSAIGITIYTLLDKTNVTGIKEIDYFLFGLSFVCAACGWWENFLDDRFPKTLNRTCLSIRYEQQEGRHYTAIAGSLCKLGIMVLLTYVHSYVNGYGNYVEKLKDYIFDYKDKHDSSIFLAPVILLNVCGIVIWYTSYLACKLNMQVPSFSIPLLLASPIAMIIVCLDCIDYFPKDVFFQKNICSVDTTKYISLPWYFGILWYLSFLWITRHIWFPRQERLAKYGRMFVNSLYCGMFTTENCMLNRRRHMRQVQKHIIDKEKDAKEVNYKLSNSERKDADDVDNADIDETDAEIPNIYACATMWHETRVEMLQILKSLHRIDADQWLRRMAQEYSGSRDPDFYNYQAHIFFDDAMELNDDDEWQVNDFVEMLVDCMEEVVSSVYNQPITPHAPIKIPTPYGGKLLYKMAGGNELCVHLKDKNKIRHRKRWSQVMYMYFLLGYNLLKDCQDVAISDFKDETKREQNQWKSSDDLNSHLSEEIKLKSENTFILALDGDTDFSPVAVRLLLDRMKKNKKAGAACGRIHPIGSGPLIWYQKFEYAVGHWLQKASEHVFGCVLCSPGCFSLFRGSALMDENVMRKYTILPTQPSHYLQYDQGEDRWLCTLLLQQGYRVDYAAAADAYTYAPEGFNEFFNQRRRWMPSTLANIMDLLNNATDTIAINSNISRPYIIYQGALMVSTILGPATVLMMIAAAFTAVFKWPIEYGYILSLGPTVIYVIICMKTKAKTQLLVAAFLSTMYAFIMVMVFAGTLITAVTTSLLDPSVIFLIILIGMFLIAGLLHPYEIWCLPAGALYFICIPSGYLLLVIYSFANLDNVSWGTREIPKKKTRAELAAEKKAAEEKKKQGGFLAKIFCNRGIIEDIKEITQVFLPGRSSNDKLLEEMKSMNHGLKQLLGHQDTDTSSTSVSHQDEVVVDFPSDDDFEESENKPKKAKIKRDDMKNPFWIEDYTRVLKGRQGELDNDETQFWKGFIKKYLAPLDKDPQKEKLVKTSLQELRTNVMFMMCMANLLWIGVNFMFQISRTQATTFSVKYKDTNNTEQEIKVEILGLIFIIFFGVMLVIQFLGMIAHRWGTILHLTSITELRGRNKSKSAFQQAIDQYRAVMDVIVADPTKLASRASEPTFKDNVPATRETWIKSSDLPTRQHHISQKLLDVTLLPIDFRATEGRFKKRGINLRKTKKSFIHRAKHEGVFFEDPVPDYDDDIEDGPVEKDLFGFMQKQKGGSTMSKQMARKYDTLTLQNSMGPRTRHNFSRQVLNHDTYL